MDDGRVVSSTPVSTPLGVASKRVLSDGSTPSPSSTYAQVAKKLRVPGSESAVDAPLEAAHSELVRAVVAEVAEQLRATITEQVSASVTAMAQSVADIVSSSFDDRMTAVEAENRGLKEQVKLLEGRVNELEEQQRATSRGIDAAEQYSRRSCLRISGLPEDPSEATDNIVLDVAKACGVKLVLADIERSHRVPARGPRAAGDSRPRDVIVKFVSYRSRAALYGGKANLRGNEAFARVYINEDLTRIRASLLRSARQLVRSSKITSAWSYDGRIFVKCLDGSRRLIGSNDDINGFQ